LLSLSQPYTGATAVLVDELDARGFFPLHSTFTYLQTDTNLAGLIVSEMNAGLL
jgi:hypothetical protein